MSILVHNDYLEETTRLLQLQKIDLLQDFEPTSPTLLRDPKFDDATEAQRTAAATEIHQRRLINIALRIPVNQRKLSVARSFLKQDWITIGQFTTLVHTVRPPTKPTNPAPSTSTSSNMQLDSTTDSLADGSSSAPSN